MSRNPQAQKCEFSDGFRVGFGHRSAMKYIGIYMDVDENLWRGHQKRSKDYKWKEWYDNEWKKQEEKQLRNKYMTRKHEP